MNNQENPLEKKARIYVDQLKQQYVIDILTTERLQEILVYLFLSQNSRNQRGVALQTENLKNILQQCSRITVPAYSSQMQSSGLQA
jgi:hypothetical protein